MPFIKHKPPPKPPCRSPEHNPPAMIVLPPGTHTWQCPCCGETVTFTVIQPLLSDQKLLPDRERWTVKDGPVCHTASMASSL